jgi:hypothetical protein
MPAADVKKELTILSLRFRLHSSAYYVCSPKLAPGGPQAVL